MEIIIDTGIKYTHKVKPKEWEIEFINIEKEKNMEEKIKELEKQIAELKAELEKEKLRLNKGDDYYYINAFGGISRYIEYNDSADDSLYEFGNYFKSEEEAEKIAKKLKAIAKVSRAILIANGDWKPDWSNYSNKYYIYYCYYTADALAIGDTLRHKIKMILPYMKTKKIAEKIIEDYEEELKIIFEIGV